MKSTYLVAFLFLILFGCSSTKKTVETSEQITYEIKDEIIKPPPVIVNGLPAEKMPDVDTTREVWQGENENVKVTFTKEKGKGKFDVKVQPPKIADRDTNKTVIQKEKTTIKEEVAWYTKLWYQLQGIWHFITIAAVVVIVLVLVVKR